MKTVFVGLILAICFISACGVTGPTPNSTWTDESLQDCVNSEHHELCVSLLSHRYLDGNHPVRKLIPQTKTETTTEAHAGFFLIAGGYDSETKTKTKSTVTFAWLMADGAYAISTIPLNRVRIKLVDKTDPYVYFKWHTTEYDPDKDIFGFGNTARFYSAAIHEVTVVCRPEDWPVEIQLPLNK